MKRGPMLALPFDHPVLSGRFLRRYKRFFVDVVLDDGREVTAHTSNTGSMTGMLSDNARVLVTHDPAPHRKLHYTLQAIDIDGAWAGCHTTLPNRVIEVCALAGKIRGLKGFRGAQREVRQEVGEHLGRLDLKLSGHRTKDDVFIEVKTVTLKVDKVARFPDAKSPRGTRHLELLRALSLRGHSCALVFVCQRPGMNAVGPAYDIDPEYADALHRAKDAGVLMRAIEVAVDRRGLHFVRALPVVTRRA